jgi:putative two-component system response regulator
LNILIADDDPITLSLLSTQLSKWGHIVHKAMDGDEAWKTIESKSIDILLVDWVMPGLDGERLSHKIRQRKGPYIYLIMISALDTKADIIAGLKSGVDEYIPKPIDLNVLRARIDIGSRIVNLERTLNRKVEIITDNHYQIIRMFSQLVEVFDEELGGHCRRTAELAVKLAKRHPEIGNSEIPTIETAALLHDIGMIGIPKAILNKRKTEMVNDEGKLYRSHPAMGARIVGEIEILRPAALLVRTHHEQFNGKGFPDEISGEEIPTGAQIISAASIYDNLKYKGEVRLDLMPERLQQMSGYQLSPSIVNMLIKYNLSEQHAEKKRKNEERVLDQLKPGMVLAANVYMKTGAFVMAANSELTARHIDKLNHYYRIGAISDKVLVRKLISRV